MEEHVVILTTSGFKSQTVIEYLVIKSSPNNLIKNLDSIIAVDQRYIDLPFNVISTGCIFQSPVGHSTDSTYYVA